MEYLVRDLRIDIMMLLLVIYLIAKTFRRRHESLKHYTFHKLLWVGLMQVLLVMAILYGDTLQGIPAVVDFIILLAYFFGLCLCTYGWFIYSEITLDSPLIHNRRARLLLVTPLVFYFLLCATSWWTKLLMYVDDNGLYQRGSWSFLQFLIPGIYAFVLVCRALARWKRVGKFDAYQRGVLFFPIIHAVAIVLQILYGGDYIVIATVASLVVAYIELYSIEEFELDTAVQQATLLTDALTGLRNRRYLFQSLQQLLDQKRQTIYYVVNMHDFKHINMLYGQKKGDELISSVSVALREAFPELDIYRQSGDEFCFLVEPKEFNQSEMSRVAQRLFSALHKVKVEDLKNERYYFAIGAVCIDPENYNNPDEILIDGVIATKRAHEHTGNFIWSEQGSFPDVEGCFMVLSEDRERYNGLNNRLFSIHNEQDWFNYLHDGARLKENMFRQNVSNIDDILAYYKTPGLPDFEFERLFQLVIEYASSLDPFMFEMLLSDILIPYFESLPKTDRECSYLGHLYLLMADSLISILRMGDTSQLPRIREMMQKVRDITRHFPHDHIHFEPYFYALCEIVGHYESLQGELCDISYADQAYDELRELLVGEDRFVIPDTGAYNYFAVLVDNARLFPIYRACYLLRRRELLTPEEKEEFEQRLSYIKAHQVDGVYDLAPEGEGPKRFVAFLQTILFQEMTLCERVDRFVNALNFIRTNQSYGEGSNIVAITYLFLGASQALAKCAKSDAEKRRIGIEGMELLLEILRKRQSYATDSQIQFLIQVLMKSMFSSPVLSPALKYHYIKQAISATTLDTYCHSTAVASYAKLILKGIIDERPELLVGPNRPYKQVEDVKANRENLLELMECGCMLHDIGKIDIVPITSNAYRRLTDQEFGFIRRHPAFGISYLKNDKAFDVFHPFVYEHHRWWNGEAGYPRVVANETPSELKVLVDILSICDSLEAATSRIGRNYRTAKNFLQILDEFVSDAGVRYSVDIVNFIVGSQKTFYQLRLMVDKNWQKEYLSIFQEVVSRQGTDYAALSHVELPGLYTHNVTEQTAPAEETQNHTFLVPEWYKSMEQKEQSIFTATLFEYSRLMSKHESSVIFFYTVDTDRVGFLHPTPDGKVETIFINHFSEQRINLVLSEEGYHKAIGIIHRIIKEPDFPKQGEEKLEYSDKRRCLIATYTSIVSQEGQVLSIAGRLQDITLSTDRLLKTINSQNKFIEIFDSIRKVFVVAIYSDIRFENFEIIKGFPTLEMAATSMTNTVELKYFVCENIVDDEYQEAFLEFLDHTTIQERLRGKPYLTLEYHSKLSGWLVARLIPVSFDAEGNILQLILVCESIEQEHEQKAFLQYAANYDSMTGLLNRARGEELIGEEIAKGSQPQIFAILDCDHFKQINDQLSHLAGDKVLTGQGHILKDFFADNLCMRLGGDEFVAYINGDDASRLINSFNGLQQYFGQLKQQLSTLHLTELENIPPTMSMGVVYATASSKPQDFESLYRMADEALKQSKKKRFGAITITQVE